VQNPKRYEIYLANVSPVPGGQDLKIRPVVVVSKNEMNRHLNTVLVCLMTSRLHPSWKSRLQIVCDSKRLEIAADQIHTIPKHRLKRKIGQITAEKASALRVIITEMYGE